LDSTNTSSTTNTDEHSESKTNNPEQLLKSPNKRIVLNTPSGRIIWILDEKHQLDDLVTEVCRDYGFTIDIREALKAKIMGKIN